MIDPNAPALSKLPKWAQGEFKRLEGELRQAKESERKVLDSQTPTKIVIDPYERDVMNLKFVQSDKVTFILNGHSKITVSLDKAGDAIEVCSTGHPSRLMIMPQVSNVVTIGTTERL